MESPDESVASDASGLSGMDKLADEAALAGLRQTLADEVSWYYQPVLDLATSTTVYLEALVRWRRGTRLVSPQELLRTLRTPAQIDLFTKAGLDYILADLGRIKQIFGPTTSVALNLSSAQLRRGDITVDLIEQALRSAGAAPEDLRIEIVEDVTSAELPAVVAPMRRLRDLGVKVLLDDFGTGASSLTALTDLAYDSIKIDRTFVASMRSQQTARSVIEAIVAFGASAEIEVIAEGVEDAFVLNELERLGCRMAQGYLFGEPIPLDALRPRPQSRLPHQPVSEPVRLRPESAEAKQRSEIVRRQIEKLNPRSTTLSFSDMCVEFASLRSEAELLGITGRHLLTDLLAQMTTASIFANEHDKTVEWALEASRRAEEEQRFGLSAQMLACIGGVPATNESSRFVGAEALARALQIRATEEIIPEELSRLDNTLGTSLADMGLLGRAVKWWNQSIEKNLDTDHAGDAFAAINLVEAELGRLNGVDLRLVPVDRHISEARIERALAKLAKTEHVLAGVSESLHARYAIACGDADKAIEHLGEWQNQSPSGAVSIYFVLRARALVAHAQGDTESFVKLAEELYNSGGFSLMPQNRFEAQRLLVDALAASGRLEEAFELQRSLVGSQAATHSQQAMGLFDWLQVRVNFNLQFAHLLNFLGFEGRPADYRVSES